MRDYGKDAEKIWGGESECDHIWGDKIKNPKRDDRDPETKKSQGSVAGTSANSENWSKGDMGKYCQKCGSYKCQLGMEVHPQIFINNLVEIFREVKRVLKENGSFWLNLGDSYYSAGAGHKDVESLLKSSTAKPKNLHDLSTSHQRLIKNDSKWLQRTQLLGIPWRVAIAMQDDGWILRNAINWHRPNSMPSSAFSRFSVDFEYVFFFVKNRKYYFNQQFEPYIEDLDTWGKEKLKSVGSNRWDKETTNREGDMEPSSQGKNKRTTWSISTVPSSEAHFALFPESLVRVPIDAGCPRHICKSCCEPRTQIRKSTRDRVEENKIIDEINSKGGKYTGDEYQTQSTGEAHRDLSPDGKTRGAYNKTEIVGLSKCDCNAGFEPGIVLDIFAGTGTTCLVAKKQGKNYIGFEINPKYCKMARKRLASHVSINKWL